MEKTEGEKEDRKLGDIRQADNEAVREEAAD